MTREHGDIDSIQRIFPLLNPSSELDSFEFSDPAFHSACEYGSFDGRNTFMETIHMAICSYVFHSLTFITNQQSGWILAIINSPPSFIKHFNMPIKSVSFLVFNIGIVRTP